MRDSSSTQLKAATFEALMLRPSTTILWHGRALSEMAARIGAMAFSRNVEQALAEMRR